MERGRVGRIPRGYSVVGCGLFCLFIAGACGKVERADPDGGSGDDDDGPDDGGDTTPPTVESTTPGNNAAGIEVDAVISATFSEAMDASSLTASSFLVFTEEDEVEGTVSYDGLVVTFTPTGPLHPGTSYTVKITTGATDEAGNPLDNDYQWFFTTLTTICVKPGGGAGCRSTLAEAIAASAPGDSIAVAEGTYTENLLVDKTVVVLGGFSEDFTERDFTTRASEIRPADELVPIIQISGDINATSAVAPTFDGFTVTGANANDHGGAFHVTGSDVQLRNNILIDNQAFFLGGAVWIQYGSPHLIRNRVENNVSSGQSGCSGGGVALEATSATMAGNVVIDNQVPVDLGSGGGVVISGGGPILLLDNRIEGNQVGAINTDVSGGGVAIYNATEVSIIGGTISGNSIVSRGSGGGLFATASSLTVEAVTIRDNAAGPMGGIGSGISVDASSFQLKSSIVAGNLNGPSGVALGVNGTPALINNTIADNGGACVHTDSSATIYNNVLTGCMVGVQIINDILMIVRNNDFFGNDTDVSGFVLEELNSLVDPELDEEYHLTADSPILDIGAPGPFMQAGATGMIELPGIDVDGEPRVMVGPSGNSRVDIGADELTGR